VAVGGTTLAIDPTTGARVESAWASTGGGLSAFEPQPAYQASVQATGRRSAVDVSLDANPSTGVLVYSSGTGGWAQVGGTSLSSPVFAGLIAIADQGRALAGRGTLDGATQTLPLLYSAPAGSFNDITTGSRATPGYDTATGLGSPNAATLVNFLSGGTTTTTGGTTTGGTTTGSSTGGTTTGGTTGGTTTAGGTTTPPPAPTHHPRRQPRGLFIIQFPTGTDSFGGASGVWTIYSYGGGWTSPMPVPWSGINPDGFPGQVEAIDALIEQMMGELF